MQSTRIVYNIAAFLGIAPFYSPLNGGSPYPRLNKVYGVVLAIVMVSGRCYIGAEGNRLAGASWTRTRGLLRLFDELILCSLMASQLLKSCVLGQKQWLKMRRNFRSFRRLSSFFRIKRGSGSSTRCFFKQHPKFIVIHVAVVAVQSTMAYSAFPRIFFSLLYQVTFYVFVYICLTIHYLASNITREYQELNRLLLVTFDGATKREDRVENWRLFTYLRLLHDTVEAFNAIFGYSMLLIVARFFILAVRGLYLGIYNKQPNADKSFGGRGLRIGLEVAKAITLLTCTALVLIPCDAIKGAQESTRSLCNELQEKLHSTPTARAKVLCMARFIRNKPAAFTAADFFDVDRTIVFGTCNIVVTYLIVIIQFNGVSVN